MHVWFFKTGCNLGENKDKSQFDSKSCNDLQKCTLKSKSITVHYRTRTTLQYATDLRGIKMVSVTTESSDCGTFVFDVQRFHLSSGTCWNRTLGFQFSFNFMSFTKFLIVVSFLWTDILRIFAHIKCSRSKCSRSFNFKYF